MKSKSLRLVTLCVLLFAIAAALHAWFSPKLPSITLKDGREVRILKVSGGVTDWDDLGSASSWKSRMLVLLPERFRNRFYTPRKSTAGSPIKSVWVVIIKPDEKFDLREAVAALPGIKGGGIANYYGWPTGPYASQMVLVWFVPNHGLWQGDLRRLDFSDVPHDAREFHFLIDPDATPDATLHLERGTAWPRVNERTAVHFTIPNPAYRRP